MHQISIKASLNIVLQKLQPLYTQRQYSDIAENWKQPPEKFCKKSVLKNFAKFTGKHLYQGLFFNKVVRWRVQLYLKSDSDTVFFPVNYAKFPRTPFLLNTSELLDLKNSFLALSFWFWFIFQELIKFKIMHNWVVNLLFH